MSNTNMPERLGDIVCIATGDVLVDKNGKVLIDCVRAGRGSDTWFQEAWIRLDRYDHECDSLESWDSINRYKAGTQLPPYMY